MQAERKEAAIKSLKKKSAKPRRSVKPPPDPSKPKRVSKRGRVNEGRAPLYDRPEVMHDRIAEYFRYCDLRTASKVDDDGKTVTYPNPEAYTIAGLCHWLGFEDTDRLTEYQKKPEFAGTIKRARLKVKSWWEGRLGDKSPVGAIFWLKNNGGYRDQTDHQVSGGVTIRLDATEAKAIGINLNASGGHTSQK